MATESYLREDLDESLQRGFLEAKLPQPGPEYDLHRVDHSAAATEQDAQPISAALESQLPSTVPKSQSQFPSNVETQLEPISPAAGSEITPPTRQKMASQISDGATQELSPSHYNDIITRSRSELQLREQEQERDFHKEREQDSDSEVEADVTQHLGDSAYVDLISSLDSQIGAANDENEEDQTAARDESERELGPTDDYVGVLEQQTEVANEELGGQEHAQEDSEPIEVGFSPTQSQIALSQYPESQRFKTPATTGKKRRYNGDVIDSPELPRNSKPSLREGDSNDLAIGLTQAFGATQDNTSPFVGPINVNLHSDRPSPSINLQPRPVTAVSSSPMKPISSIKRSARAITEPLDHYESSRESQARREEVRRREHEKILENYDPEEDVFEIPEDSWMARDRREHERERKIRAQLLSSSSPTLAAHGMSMSKSSPVRGAQRSSPIQQVKRPKFPVKSSPPKPSQESQVTESEEETEQEDNADIEVTGSSQQLLPLDEEDKENFADRASQIPETTARPQRILCYSPQVQESPLIRHGRGVNGEHPPTAVNSSQHFAVADSQPERSVSRYQTITQVPRSSTADEGLDFVPQSPESSPRPTAPVVRDLAPALMFPPRILEDQAGNTADRAMPASSIESRHQRKSTIPETSSNEEPAQIEKESGDKPETSESGSRGEFDTAQTHLQPSAAAVQATVVELSNPPILTTPPGKRRTPEQNQIEEINAMPSPDKSQSSFNPSPALGLDANFASPFHGSLNFYRLVGRPAKETTRKVEIPNVVATEAHSDSVEPEEHQGPNHSHTNRNDTENNVEAEPDEEEEDGDDDEPIVKSQIVQPAPPLSTYPRRDRKPTAKELSSRTAMIASTALPARVSQYELPDSPPQKMVAASKPPAKLKRKVKLTANPSNETAPGPSKRLKPAKSTPASPTYAAGNLRKQPDSPDPIALQETASVNEPAQPGTKKDPANTGGDDILAPNMVFAVFNGNSRTYHPALCLGRPDADSNRFKIQWEGYDPDVVDEYGVRSLDLRVGDQIKIDMQGFPKVSHVIRGFKDRTKPDDTSTKQIVTDIRGYQTLLVAPKKRKSLPADISTDNVKKVPISAIYLDSIMWGQMKERIYRHKPALDTTVSTARSTPAPQIASSPPSTPPSRSRRGTGATIPPISSAIDLTEGIFSKMAFAISYDDNVRRRNLVELVKENGGVILKESFLDLFQPNSMQLKEHFSELTFTALLTDRHSRKPKYLQALALGLPCLSGRWIEASILAAQFVDWTSYLLAAGESLELEGATKSRSLSLPSAIQHSKVRDIIALRAKIFADARVVAVKGRGLTEEKYKHFVALIRALGPRQIDLEPDLNSAQGIIQSAAGTDDLVDYIFVGDSEVEAARELFMSIHSAESKDGPKGKRKGGPKKASDANETESDTKSENWDTGRAKVKVICNEDIVQSLILGRLRMGL